MTLSVDRQYQHLPRPNHGVEHRYGDKLFLHSNPYPMSILRRLCAPETTQPLFNQYVEALYDFLLSQVVSLEFETEQVATATRMRAHNKEAVYQGEAILPRQQVVVVDIARAGILPSARLYSGFHHILDPDCIRMDHVFMNRATNEKGEVIGVNFSGSKIGGPVAGRTVIIPDPMAATGGSMLTTLDLYRSQPGGAPKRFIACHLIVTPEYVRRLTAEAPDLTIHAIRLDRGLSKPEAFDLLPGERPDLEKGLNDHQYIVPGGGGFGELINNALI